MDQHDLPRRPRHTRKSKASLRKAGRGGIEVVTRRLETIQSPSDDMRWIIARLKLALTQLRLGEPGSTV